MKEGTSSVAYKRVKDSEGAVPVRCGAVDAFFIRRPGIQGRKRAGHINKYHFHTLDLTSMGNFQTLSW